MKVFILIAFCVLVVLAKAENPFAGLSPKDIKFKTWAVLAAGSSGFGNYRHQADVLHAYHVLHDLGIPEDHIIIMMVDDIAYNSLNPFPGKVFNDERHIDYYQGVPLDYTGNLVTKDNFMKILMGEEMTVGSKKTLKSGPDDNVFVFYDDHGNYDVLAFPDKSVNSTNMQTIIDTMASKKMFKNLVFYIEACFSGSMFYKLKLPDNVYVTTAAPTGVSSYGGCIDENFGDFGALCDVYAHSWITDLEKYHKDDYTFNDQFQVILEGLVTFSQGCAYGNNSLSKMPINEFFAPSYGTTKRTESSPYKYKNVISNLDFEFEVAKRVYEKKRTVENLKKLRREQNIRDAVDNMGRAIVSAAKPDARYLASVPCSNCDESCLCFKECLNSKKSDDYCAFECCNEESCYNDPPDEEMLRRDSCVVTLSQEFSDACGRSHPYLLKNTLLFIRVCKHSDVDIDSAIREIRSQCRTFNISAF